jgi:predicted RNA-binding protein YlxR (DUF448 family)
VPVRTCAACRRKGEKSVLLRWVVGADGCAAPDVRAVLPGRGAYVCRADECLDRLIRGSRRTGIDFRTHEKAFRLAIRGGVVQNVPGETHEN